VAQPDSRRTDVESELLAAREATTAAKAMLAHNQAKLQELTRAALWTASLHCWWLL
jgi:hypothetical protein